MIPDISILFFGTPEFALPALRGLIDAKYSLAGIVTQPDMPMGRNRALTPPPVKVIAEQYGISVFQPERLDPRDFAAGKIPHADIFVVAAYGKIIPADILAIPRFGAINIHPSLLPRWRGPSPIQTAILAGDRETGVTIMQMDAQMDHGPILANDTLEMPDKITYPELHDLLAKLGAKLLIDTLPQWIAGILAPVVQDESQASYCPLLTKNSGRIDWEKPAEEIERMIRAYHPWPGTWTIWKTDTAEWRIRIEDADAVPVVSPAPNAASGTVWQNANCPLLVSSGQGSLAIKKLGREGRSVTDAASFLRGHPSLIGATLT